MDAAQNGGAGVLRMSERDRLIASNLADGRRVSRRRVLAWIAGSAALAHGQRSLMAWQTAPPVADDDDPFVLVCGKKGLQVQMADDARSLGVKHAALNINLTDLIVPPEDNESNSDHLVHSYSDQTFRFRRAVVERHDQQIRELSDHGMLVYLILLAYQHSDERVNQLMIHPKYDRAAPNRLGALNVATAEGRQWLKAVVQMMSDRWSGKPSDGPRVAGYIVGNEVNSHWYWSNRGRVSLEEFADEYEQAVRLVHQSVRQASSWARVYLSLEHHWNIRYPAADELQAFAGRPFMERFAQLARERGDFDWHLAFHPYPEDLGNPRFWNDRSATFGEDTPRITFRNLPVLLRFLAQPSMTYQGTPRRVILSEQGFHTPDTTDGESLQAAAYCYASKIVQRLDGIDAFILHRHVDHAHEGGLKLGLWTRQAQSVATPDRQKLIYECFRAAETSAEDDAFRFALPIVGLSSWAEIPMQ